MPPCISTHFVIPPDTVLGYILYSESVSLIQVQYPGPVYMYQARHYVARLCAITYKSELINYPTSWRTLKPRTSHPYFYRGYEDDTIAVPRWWQDQYGEGAELLASLALSVCGRPSVARPIVSCLRS